MERYKNRIYHDCHINRQTKCRKEIGRIIGATRVRNGYVEGNGYMVTWTFGNMLSLAMPKDYGTQKLERNDFPFIRPNLN